MLSRRCWETRSSGQQHMADRLDPAYRPIGSGSWSWGFCLHYSLLRGPCACYSAPLLGRGGGEGKEHCISCGCWVVGMSGVSETDQELWPAWDLSRVDSAQGSKIVLTTELEYKKWGRPEEKDVVRGGELWQNDRWEGFRGRSGVFEERCEAGHQGRWKRLEVSWTVSYTFSSPTWMPGLERPWVISASI